MRPLLIAITPLLSLFSSAQSVIDVSKRDVTTEDANFFFAGQPFVNTKFVRLVQGSPYFRDEWMKGSVMVNGGKEYVNNLLKLELVDNVVLFKDSLDREMEATGDLKQVKLFDTVIQKVYVFINAKYINATDVEKGWYQILTEGAHASLFKQNGKRLRENKPYGSATYEQYIDDVEVLFIWSNSKFVEVKKIKDLIDIFSDKKTEIQDYINQHKLSKSENDLVSVVNYYNYIK